jgi:hypothetical protein
MRPRSLLLGAILSALTLSAQRIPDVTLASGETGRTTGILFKAGAETVVTAASRSTAGFSFASAVYRIAKPVASDAQSQFQGQGDLIDTDDPESTDVSWTWSAPEEGEYYFVFRNITALPGAVQVATRQGKGSPAPSAKPKNYAQVEVLYATNRRCNTNSSGCCASIPNSARVSAGKSRKFAVTITSARPRIAAANTCRSFGSGSCRPGIKSS